MKRGQDVLEYVTDRIHRNSTHNITMLDIRKYVTLIKCNKNFIFYSTLSTSIFCSYIKIIAYLN